MMYGIQKLSKKILGAKPHIAVVGPNVGNNLGTTVLLSGTVDAATEASKLGVPGLAFSGDTGNQTAWNVEPVPAYSQIYANLSTTVTKALVNSGKPYLPSNTWLNVNFPATSDCSTTSEYMFVLSRINTATAAATSDVKTCGNGGDCEMLCFDQRRCRDHQGRCKCKAAEGRSREAGKDLVLLAEREHLAGSSSFEATACVATGQENDGSNR